MLTVYYRSCGKTPYGLYRVEAPSIPAAPGGGWNLSAVPAGTVSAWDGAMWVPAKLPVVGDKDGQVRHTKNTAGVGVPKPVPAPAPEALPVPDAAASVPVVAVPAPPQTVARTVAQSPFQSAKKKGGAR